MVSPYLDSCLAMVVDATRGVSEAAGTTRHGDRWSVVEIVEHLQRTYSGTAKGFERCLEKGAPLATKATLTQIVQTFVVINLGHFPEGRTAPRHVVPAGTEPLPVVLDAIARDLRWLDDAAVRARTALGSGKMLDHPILGALTVDQWLRFHLIHTRHHEKQIRARR
ncbi:MAG: DUF1569 domain-containing protein [Legionella sp.]|nr:DUF1569 domain-containing protein [Legionella sp.]